MKILVTGFTLGQSGRPPDIGYVTLSPILCQLFRDLGHDVTTKTMSVGEDLDAYDLIVAGIISPFSVASKYIYGMVSLLDRYFCDGRRPVISFIDDWTLHQIDQNARSTRRVLSRLTRPSIFARRPGYDWATSAEGYSAIARVMEKVTETGWPPMILPLFGFGNAEVFKPIIMAEAYWPLDPVSYSPAVPFERVHPADRQRRWVLAVIQDHPEYVAALGESWPLLQLGGGLTKRDTLVPVTEVMQEYAKSWGVLCPPYKRLQGGGWWRERMVHSAMVRAVCFCGKDDVPQLGEPYQASLKDIEAMTTGQMYDLAEAQADALRAACWRRDRLHAEAEVMLKSVML